MGPVVDHNTCLPFGNIRDYEEKMRVLLESIGALLFYSSAACHLVSSLEEALPP